jgi:O-antigen/teichoic acid export membrane protein
LSWFLPLGLSFVATPIILRGLGIEKYGLYTLVLGFISYSFTFNIGKAIVKYVSEFQATNKTEKISEIISATLLLNLIVGGLGMLLVLFFSKWFVVNVLQIESALQDEAVTAFHLAAWLILATMFSQAFSSIIQAVHRFDVYSYITIGTNCLLAAGNIVLALANQKIETLLVWSLLLTVLNSAIFYFYARRLIPEFALKIVFPKEILRLILRYSAGDYRDAVFCEFPAAFRAKLDYESARNRSGRLLRHRSESRRLRSRFRRQHLAGAVSAFERNRSSRRQKRTAADLH